MIGPKFYAWDKNGKPLAFGKLYTYQARTNVPKDTYQSEDQVVSNTNPVILNGEGYANVYLSGSYKMVLKDSDENEIWSSDPVTSAQAEEWVNCLSATYVSSTVFKLTGNFTTEYEAGKRVRIDNNTASYSYSTISSSVFAGGETTVTIDEPIITTGIVQSCVSITSPNSAIIPPSLGEDGGVSSVGNADAFIDLTTELSTADWLKEGKSVTSKGYNSINDLGGANWDVFVTGTYPANFDVIENLALNLQVKIRNSEGLTVEAFGAGTDDDTGLFNFFVGKNYKPIANGDYNVTALPSDISFYKGVGRLVLPSGEKIPLGNDFKQLTLNAVRPIPDADLSWVPFFPKVDSVGNVTTTEGVQHYAIERENPASVGDFYIDPVNGNDANAGSPGLPLKTLTEFLRVKAANNGYMMGSDDPDNPVVFDKSDFRDTDPVGNRLKIVNVNGHCKIAEPVDDLTSLTWTLESGQVYKCTTTSAKINQLRYTKALDQDGGYLKIPSFTNVTDVNNSVFGFWHDVANNTLYARIGSTAGDTFKADLQPIVSDAASKMLFLGTAILFYCPKGSSLQFDGVYLQPLVSGSTRPRLYLHAEEPNGIEIKNTFTHGIDALGAEYYTEHVKVTSTGGDNFHGFDSGGVSTLAVEVNCDSSFAGDFGTRGALAAGTDNGSAMHGTGHVARFGGKYYKNYGPDVVDSGSGAFWNCGVEAFGSTLPGNAIGFDITAGTGRMYLDTCLARDEDLDEIQVNAGAVLRTFNTTGEVNEVSTGVEYDYDPLNPL